MTYPKTLSELGKQTLATITPRLEQLGDGEGLDIRDIPEGIDTIRYYLYTWLHHQGLQGRFTLRREASTCLRVTKRRLPKPTIIGAEPQAGELFARDRLAETETEDAVLEIINQAVEKGEIDEASGAEALQEWRRVMG